MGMEFIIMTVERPVMMEIGLMMRNKDMECLIVRKNTMKVNGSWVRRKETGIF